MLSVKEISKSYIRRGIVLDNLSLEAAKGDAIAIMGPSGSGKTTLLNIIGLLDKPDSGHLQFMGREIGGYSENEAADYRNANIGFVFQDNLLLPHLTIRENILLPAMARQNSVEEYNVKVEYAFHLMQRTGISGLEAKYPSEISGGEAQRSALVRAMVNKPSIILADEPTGSLDSKNAELLGEILTAINTDFGTTLILATHSEKLSEKMRNRFLLKDGKLEKI
jgi:lipoprotein-releasing system ATP-binding protein